MPWIKKDEDLTEEEVKNNSLLLYDKLQSLGWDEERAVAGMMVAFIMSHCNPTYTAGTCWDKASSTIRYGIFQVPAEEYFKWCTDNNYDSEDGDIQATYFDYCLRNNIYWYGICYQCCAWEFKPDSDCTMTSADFFSDYLDYPFMTEFACLLFEGFYNMTLNFVGSESCDSARNAQYPYNLVSLDGEQVPNYFGGCLVDIGYECNSYYPSQVAIRCTEETPIEEYTPHKMPVYMMVKRWF